MSVRWIALAAAMCDIVVAWLGPTAGLPWLAHAGVVIAIACALAAFAPTEERCRVIGTLAAVGNLFVLCGLALYALCAEVDFFDDVPIRGELEVAAVAALGAMILDVVLAACADRAAPRIPPAQIS